MLESRVYDLCLPLEDLNWSFLCVDSKLCYGFWFCRYTRILVRSMEWSTRRLRYLLDTEELIRNHGVDLILGMLIIFFLFVFLLLQENHH